jgi:hypothetical protein
MIPAVYLCFDRKTTFTNSNAFLENVTFLLKVDRSEEKDKSQLTGRHLPAVGLDHLDSLCKMLEELAVLRYILP